MLRATRACPIQRQRRALRILALESSADDTCAAVVSDRKILSNVVLRQNRDHEPRRGIYPLLALHLHQRRMPTAVRTALDLANLTIHEVDGVAFTRGPGITGCLTVAANAAKTLAAATGKPLVGVHHMQAHALTAIFTSPNPPQFPFLTLLVSGGHTMIVLATSVWDFQILATTADRAIGSAIDRVVARLEIPWAELGPGPGLEKYCAEPVPDDGTPTVLPGPVMPRELGFSFTGLQSWVDREIDAVGGLENLPKRAVARVFQTAVFAQLEDKLLRALKLCEKRGIQVRHVAVSGGVASNQLLRARLKQCLEPRSVELHFPDPLLCTDNAVMIGWASLHRFLDQHHDDYSIHTIPTWSIEQIRDPPPPAPVK
ncbi:tRNA N6-adenosine threonylcarbamoyltransferase, mitochondrial [Mycena kentingensis (nom. inval.)]|nr:tRNA N6-adenosine threonylcarbamoyltransferase, mitochondrial [Mycena kentingensis (nom. inval.)]